MSFDKLEPNFKLQIVKEAKSFIVWNLTVRELAKSEKVSKSTIYNRLVKILPEIDYPLYLEVRKVLDKNKIERNKRGGIKTKEKYLRKK